jgi:hypothetical protein
MSHTRIKIVTSKAGKKMYYIGDGLWFGRISEKKALEGLSTGKYILWAFN